MKAKKNQRERSPQMRQVSSGLRDVLGMTQWRQEHPKATFRELEAAVCAVQDGAEWLPGLVDYHRAEAVRILAALPMPPSISATWAKRPQARTARLRKRLTSGKHAWKVNARLLLIWWHQQEVLIVVRFSQLDS